MSDISRAVRHFERFLNINTSAPRPDQGSQTMEEIRRTQPQQNYSEEGAEVISTIKYDFKNEKVTYHKPEENSN